jgi:hypothetical protein
MIVAILVLPCCGGVGLIGALSGDDKSVDAAKAADNVVVEPTQQAGDQPSDSVPSEVPTDSPTEAAPTTAPASQPSSAAPVVTTKKVTKRTAIAFTTRTVKDPDLEKGDTEVRTKGVAGLRTITYEVTLTDGKETARKQISSVVTKKPVTKVVAVGSKTSGGGGCSPNYSGCVPIASDVDCAGGSGDGPAYVDGPVDVIGSDIYRLDNDKDGVACDT